MKLWGFFCYLFIVVSSTMIKKECPIQEVHKSCFFFEEYTCWAQEDRLKRVKVAPVKLLHCKAGCFCKRAFVREYPGGPCIQASGCRDQRLKLLLDKLPIKFPYIAQN